MIRLGIVGSNFGRMVHLPAFRADSRCEVVALAGSDATRTRERATESGIAKAYGDWRALVEDKDVDAVTIATLPRLQVDVAMAALSLGKPVFAEKPLAGDLASARALLLQAQNSRRATMVDFNFHQVLAWQRAKAMLDAGEIGALRHIAVHWHLESSTIQTRVHSWKASSDAAVGGGVLGNFISHCFHYLEWFGGPIAGLSARIGGLPNDPRTETTVAMAMQFAAGPMASLSMSCASYLGSGHRLELFGEDGTLTLHNPNLADYMRGFELYHAKRPAAVLTRIPVDDPIDTRYPDGRIAPVARLAARFLDAVESSTEATPDFADGYRAQVLIDAARRSHETGAWLAVPRET